MIDITNYIKSGLIALGADLVSFGDLSEVPPEVRHGLPVGIAVAVKYPKEVIRGITQMPTLEYRKWYDILNEQLDSLVTCGAETLIAKGYNAIAQTRAQVGIGNEDVRMLPHKTVATRAGLGWIGKCALLITEEYGSMVRLSAILTDAPLETAIPINESKCGDCVACTNACPAGAVSGTLWSAGIPREDFYSAALCRETARARAMQSINENITICGKCIEVCPYWEAVATSNRE